MATANAAPENIKLDRSDGSATLELYRAALGPLHTDYYLKAFTRFDAVGKTASQWNWTAALLTLSWLLFRQLWLVALAYAGGLISAALLLVGIARLVFQVSAEVQWLLAGVAVLLATVVPGAYGNSWLYAACNKKMERALVDSATLEDACAGLAAQAPGRKRMVGLLAVNLTLLALLGAAAISWNNSPGTSLEAGQPARALPVETLQSGLATQSVAAAAAAAASAPNAAPNAVAASRISQGVVQAAPLPLATAQPPQATASQGLAPAAPAAAPAASAPSPIAVPAQSATGAMPAGNLTSGKPAPAPKPAAPAPTASMVKPAAAETYQINVGLFADANNARNAQARLRDAGLPVLAQEIKSAKGVRTRVRVGPFETLAEADRVAEKVRALKLEAVVVQP